MTYGRRKLFVLLALVVIALILRLIRLDFQPLWWDEGYSVFFSTRDFLTMLARTAVDIHPPFYYALLQLWIPLVGKSDVALRLLSVLIGIAAIPLLYLFGRDLFDRRTGLIAALLLAISPLHIYYSQEVRMYGLVTLLALASMALQMRLMRLGRKNDARHSLLRSESLSNSAFDYANRSYFARQRFFAALRMTTALRVGLWLAYILVTTAALYTQYFSAFVIAAEIIVVLYAWLRPVGATRGSPLRPWFLAWFAIFVLYLPWLIYAGPKLYAYVTAKVGIEQYPSLDPLTFIGQHLVAFSVGHVSVFPWLGWAAVIFVALALLGTVISKWKLVIENSQFAIRNSELPIPDHASRITHHASRITFYVLLYLLIPLLLGYLLNLVYTFHPIRYERLLLIAAPAFLLLVARGIDVLWERRGALAWAGLVLVALVSATSLYDFYTVERYSAEDYRPIIQEMEAQAAQGDVVLAPYPWQIGYLETYYHGPALNVFEVPSDAWGADSSQVEKGLTSLRSQSSRVWLLAWQMAGRRLEDQLGNFYSDDYRLWDNWYGNTRLEYFGQADDLPVTEQPIDYVTDLQLASFGASSGSISAGGGFVAVRLHWITRSNAYNYSLRLVNANGDKPIQQDGPIASGNEIQRLGIAIPRTLVPGDYDVRLVIYRRANGQPVALLNGEPELTLAHIKVTAPQ